MTDVRWLENDLLEFLRRQCGYDGELTAATPLVSVDTDCPDVLDFHRASLLLSYVRRVFDIDFDWCDLSPENLASVRALAGRVAGKRRRSAAVAQTGDDGGRPRAASTTSTTNGQIDDSQHAQRGRKVELAATGDRRRLVSLDAVRNDGVDGDLDRRSIPLKSSPFDSKRKTAMNRKSPVCRSWSCAAGCYLKTILGMAVFTVGVLLMATLWLIPVGVVMAITGVAMFDPGQPCV